MFDLYKDNENENDAVNFRLTNAKDIVDEDELDEEKEKIFFEPQDIVTLIENLPLYLSNRELDPKEVKKIRVNTNKYLSESIKNTTFEGIVYFAEHGIHEYLMTSFIHTPDADIFKSIVECLHCWIKRQNTIKDCFNDLNFVNAIIFVSTSFQRESSELLEYSTFNVIDAGVRTKLMEVFRFIVTNNEELYNSFDRKVIFERFVNTFLNEETINAKKRALSLIEIFFKHKYEAPLTLPEVDSLKSVIMPLCEEITNKIEPYVPDFLEILSYFYNYNAEFATFLVENFSFIEVINMAENASWFNKRTIIQTYLNLTFSTTYDFYETLLSNMNWEYFSEFMKAEKSDIIRKTFKFLIGFAQKFPIILNGEKYEDFIDECLHNYECGETVNKEMCAKFLCLVFQGGNQKVFDHLMESEFIFNCADFISGNHDDVTIMIIKAISYGASKYKLSDSELFSAYISNLQENDVISEIIEQTTSENEELAAISKEFLDTYCKSDEED